MKTVTVLYFAGVRQLLGMAEQTIELSDAPITVATLLARLSERHPDLAARLPSLRVAKNETFVHEDASVDDGDVVALIPPVQGG